jgi:MOSC domain-containing protein YiiM
MPADATAIAQRVPLGRVVSIVFKPTHLPSRPADHYTREPLTECNLVAGYGIEGDRKGGKADRDINLMSAEDLASLAEAGFHTGPGQMGEQIVVAEVEVQRLRPGDRLLLGSGACLEVVKPRTGCQRLKEIQGLPLTASSGGLGVMMRVVAGGVVRVGDAVCVEPADG